MRLAYGFMGLSMRECHGAAFVPVWFLFPFGLIDVNFALIDANFALIDANFALIDANFTLMDANLVLIDANFATLR